MPAFSIGVDLGGTNLRIAAVEESGTQLEGVDALTEISRGREKVVHELTEAVRFSDQQVFFFPQVSGAGHRCSRNY